MEKIMKVTQGKRFLSLVLAIIMMATIFNMALPMLKLEASAAGSIITKDAKETITQDRVVTDDYATKYDNYAAQFLNGASNPTNMVIPGLTAAQDYTVQGMTYYPARDWMLITAYYHVTDDEIKNGAEVYSTKVFALDAATGDFVAMFSFLNPDGTPNTEHGGGIAVSEKNIYYACGDDDRQIAYAPIAALEDAPLDQHTEIQLVDMVEFNEVGSKTSSGKTAYTAYVCYDDGVLWTGNFYDPGVLILGMPITATDYAIAANDDYNSMVFGYRLAGSTSEEEWNYLMGNVTGKDCRGNPSYVIGLNKTIKDVQYAVVDNGKLYLSCSYGTGEGTTSVSLGGMNPYSTLIVADIDLTQPGTKQTKINTHKESGKTVWAYDIQSYKSFDMMPMSEGLCVVNDNIFITFESASNKYLKEAGALTGNCKHPVDIVWQLDPNELMNTTVADKDNSIYYERVYHSDDIKSGEEYLIVHESNVKDSLTQNNYLYALNAKGNFKGQELSKSGSTESLAMGYNAMLGHPISYYSIEEVEQNGKTVERLYLGHPEEDDIEEVRWSLDKIGDTNYYIKNKSTYFADYSSLYFNASKITMADNDSSYLSKMNIGQIVAGNGYFYLSNIESQEKKYFLWCNDGIDERYNTGANNHYATYDVTKYTLLDGVTEVPGTFHTDALNHSKSNILGGEINNNNPDILYEDGAFKIYRRVVDETASTYESRVHTDLKAELQEDGTYTINLETYAISPNHYQYVGEKPTDYIIVADTSASMGSKGGTGLMEYNGSLAMGSMCSEEDTNKSTSADSGVLSYSFTNENIYLKHTDDKLYRAYLAVRTDPKHQPNPDCDTTEWLQFYYLYYIADNGLYYCLDNLGGNGAIERTYEQWMAWVNGDTSNGAIQSASNPDKNSNSSRRKEVIYEGLHYRFDNASSNPSSEVACINTLKETATNIVNSVTADNSDNRIAIIQNNGSSITQTGFIDKTTAINTINGFTTGSADGNPGNGGMDAVNSIISANKDTYDKKNNTSGRNVAVIFITDGIPDGSNATNATNAANSIINAAKTAKTNGGFIYTVNIGKNEVSGFQKKTYLDAVSSKYAAAESLTNLGGQAVDGVQYAMSVSNASKEYFADFGTAAVTEVNSNTSVVLDNLSAQSILREQLSNAFKFPADFNIATDVKVELITGAYDEVGRFSFIEESAALEENVTDAAKISVDTDIETKTLEITNYDYAKEYVAKSRQTPGRKLRVTIKGLLADETQKIQNTSINNVDTTAIYKSLENMNDGVVFKKLPTSNFNIPKYTYVLDYGLQLRDTEVNGTLKAVSANLGKQDVNNYNKISPNNLVAIENGDQNLLYTTTPTNTTDSGYVLIQRDDGTYDWFEIEVVPASNVYYEENEIETSGTSGKIEWSQTGSTDGVYRDLPGVGDPYGYDEHYDDASQQFSNNSYLKVDVTSEKGNTTSKKKSFTFTGTGFDLMSACGKNTGVLSVAVKDKDGKRVKGFMVDTYYDDANVSTMLSQVPVVKWEGAYGTYTVDISAIYVANAGGATKSVAKNNLIDTGLVMNSAEPKNTTDIAAILESAGLEDMIAEDMELVWFDDNSIFNGGTGVAPTVKKTRAGETAETVTLENYIDGFRIYNPLGTDSSAYEDSEKNAKYVNVLDNLMSSTSSIGNIGYIIGDSTNLTWADYQSVGPQGEVYLNKGQSISFNVTVDQAEKVMLGLRAVNGPTSVTISNTANNAYKVENVPINSATEMYYDITKCFGGVTASDTPVNITITNASGGILAVNHVKHSGGDGSVGNGIITRTNARSAGATYAQDLLFTPFTEANLIDVQNGMNLPGVQGVVKNGVIIPLVEEEEDIPGDNTTPDVPGDDTNNDNNDDTNTDSGEKEEFSIFSLLELLISLIEKILYNAFGAGKMA